MSESVVLRSHELGLSSGFLLTAGWDLFIGGDDAGVFSASLSIPASALRRLSVFELSSTARVQQRGEVALT